jgi:hypothetical protein
MQQPIENQIPIQTQQHQVQSIASSSETPPATSNLLQILTVLSSSNDELSESHPKSRSGPDNSSQINYSGDVFVPSSAQQSCHHVNVPHPDDESFQTFFTSRSSAFSTGTSAYLPNSTLGSDATSHDLEMDAVQRENEMLVMRKNIPIVRRKSIGKSRNPLKALAARMDFHNQWYTDGTDGNHGTRNGKDDKA